MDGRGGGEGKGDGFGRSSVINKLESVQNSFTRKLMMRALGLAYDQIPCSWARNENLGLPILLQRRRWNDLLFLHKLIHGECGLKLSHFVSMRTSITRGGATKFHIPRAKLCCRRFSFIHRVIPQFEKLRIKRALPLSYNVFKTLLHGCPNRWGYRFPDFYDIAIY